MAEIKSKMVLVDFDTQDQPLSPTQKKFNQLSSKIEAQKKQVQAWREIADMAQQRVYGKLIPMAGELVLERAKLIVVLHEAALQYKLTKIELDKLDYLVCQLCEMVLGQNLDDAQELNIKRIYAVHAGSSFDDDESDIIADQQALIKEHMKSEFDLDIDLDDIDFNNPEAFFEKLAEQHDQNQQQQKPEKKTKKQLEKEQQQQQADALANQSLKQMYKRLAAILHPDRESVETEKVKKTALMQRATEAYQANDLVALIQLQVEVNQHGLSNIAQLADEQLHLYNLNLTKYSKQLQQDIAGFELMLADLCHFDFYERVTPKKVIKKLKDDLSFMTNQHLMLKQQVDRLLSARAIKDFLKEFGI